MRIVITQPEGFNSRLVGRLSPRVRKRPMSNEHSKHLARVGKTIYNCNFEKKIKVERLNFKRRF